MKTKHICFVVQRYGKEIVGGAEMLCAKYVERLKEFYQIDVLTTCANDYNTWKNVYPEGKSREDGINIIRCKTKYPRKDDVLARLTDEVYQNPYNDMLLGATWLREVGPYSIDLIKYIKQNKDKYDLFIFVGYHYYTSTCGLPLVPYKSIFMPTAHDEAPLRKCNYFRYLFNIPKAILYLSNGEKEFVQGFFENKRIVSIVAGSGVDTYKDTDLDDATAFKYALNTDYIVYSGRIDNSKNIGELTENFISYKQTHKAPLKLILMGEKFMEIPIREDISYIGFVNEEVKGKIVANAKAFIMPSQNESLSISTLEAMSLKTPVLVCGRCQVLKEHIINSNAGLYYTNQEEFTASLNKIVTDENLSVNMGKNGQDYIKANYDWDKIIITIKELIEDVC